MRIVNITLMMGKEMNNAAGAGHTPMLAYGKGKPNDPSYKRMTFQINF